MEWASPVRTGQQQHFFSLVGVPKGQSHALTANAAALALPAPALAVAGKYAGMDGEVAVLGSDHAFGIALFKLGLARPLLTASHPVDIDWDYATGMLVVEAAQEATLQLALEGPRVLINGEARNLETASGGLTQLTLTAGRHELSGARPAAALLGDVQAGLQDLLKQGVTLRAAKRISKNDTDAEPPALARATLASVGGQIVDMTVITTPDGPLLALASEKGSALSTPGPDC